MNPLGANNMDPKLKETYDRIMGTSTQRPPITEQPKQPTPVMQTQTVEPIAQPPIIESVNNLQPQNTNTQPILNTNIFAPATQPAASSYANSQSFTAKDSSHSSSGNLLKIIVFFGGTIFFAAYAVIWAKVFELF